MNPNEWAGLAVAATTLVAALAMTVRHLVKHYLSELRPNSGSSLRDSVDRLEERIDRIYEILCDRPQ
jgi:hypothetical protein